MTDVLNWLPYQKLADVGNAYAEGQANALANQTGRFKLQEAQDQKAETDTARAQAPGIFAGDPSALATAYGANPDMAEKISGGAQQVMGMLRQSTHAIAQRLQQGDKAGANAIYQQVLPLARQHMPEEQLPDQLDAPTAQKIVALSQTIGGGIPVHSIVPNAQGGYTAFDKFGQPTDTGVNVMPKSRPFNAGGRWYNYNPVTGQAEPLTGNPQQAPQGNGQIVVPGPAAAQPGVQGPPLTTGTPPPGMGAHPPMTADAAETLLQNIEVNNGAPIEPSARALAKTALVQGKPMLLSGEGQSNTAQNAPQAIPAPAAPPVAAPAAQPAQGAVPAAPVAAPAAPAPNLGALVQPAIPGQISAPATSEVSKRAQELTDMQRAGLSITPDDQTAYMRDGKFPNELPSIVNDPTKPGGDAYLKSLPATDQAMVKAYSDGRAPIPTGAALRNPLIARFLQETAQYDPTFDAANYTSRVATRKDFTSGKSAVQLNAINTAIGHLDTLNKSVDGLHNYSGFGSGLMNAGKNMFLDKVNSDPRFGPFNTAVSAVSDELTRVYRGVGGSEADIAAWKASLSDAKSPEALKATTKAMADLLASKIENMGNQYTQGLGRSDQPLPVLSPTAIKSLEKIRGMPIDVPGQPKAAGSVPRIATQAQFDALPAGALYIEPDGKTYRKPGK